MDEGHDSKGQTCKTGKPRSITESENSVAAGHGALEARFRQVPGTVNTSHTFRLSHQVIPHYLKMSVNLVRISVRHVFSANFLLSNLPRLHLSSLGHHSHV